MSEWQVLLLGMIIGAAMVAVPVGIGLWVSGRQLESHRRAFPEFREGAMRGTIKDPPATCQRPPAPGGSARQVSPPEEYQR